MFNATKQSGIVICLFVSKTIFADLYESRALLYEHLIEIYWEIFTFTWRIKRKLCAPLGALLLLLLRVSGDAIAFILLPIGHIREAHSSRTTVQDICLFCSWYFFCSARQSLPKKGSRNIRWLMSENYTSHLVSPEEKSNPTEEILPSWHRITEWKTLFL